MSVYGDIVRQLVQQFETQLNAHEGRKTTEVFVETCQKVLTEHFKSGVKKKKSATGGTEGTTGDNAEKRLDQWPKIWTSSQYGGKTRFEEDYQRIKRDSGEKNHFKILSLLRDELEKADGGRRWK